MFYFNISAQVWTWTEHEKADLFKSLISWRPALALRWEIFNSKHSEATQKRQSENRRWAHRERWQRDGFTFCEAPLRRPLSHNALFPVGSSSTSSLVLGGRRTWQSRKKLKHLSLQLLSSTGRQMFFESLLPHVFSGPMPQRICDASD